MKKTINSFLGNEKAATAIEYSLIIAGIACVIVAAVNALGIQTTIPFINIARDWNRE